MRFARARSWAGVVLFLLAAGARADTYLVLPFENQTRNASLDWIGESFAEALSEVLSTPSSYAATRQERVAAFDRLGIPAASILSRATIIKLGETMDADYVVIGHYALADGNRLQVTAQTLEIRAQKLSSRFTESGLLRELMDIQERLGMALASALLSPALSSTGLPVALPPLPRPRYVLEAWENYIRGLIASSAAQQTRFFRQAAHLDSTLTRAALQLGKIYLQNRDYATAVPWLAKVKKDESHYLEASFLLGICHFAQHEYEKAESAFQTVAERVPLSEVYNNLGAAQSRRSRRGAPENFRKAADGDPADPDYHFNLGYWHWKTGQYAPAARRLRLALERRPNDGEARALLVKALERGGHSADAAREAELLARLPNAARFTGADDKIFEGLERIKRNYDEPSFRQLQMTLEALTEESLARLPAARHAEVHLERGRELFQEQEDAAALDELQEAADLAPGRAEAHLLLARLHERNGRPEAAVREARLSLAAQKSADAHLLLAKIYLEQGKLSEAKQQAQQALEVNPGSVAARSVLKTIEMRTP